MKHLKSATPESSRAEGIGLNELLGSDHRKRVSDMEKTYGPCICSGANECPGCNEQVADELKAEIAAANERYAVPPCLECGATSAEDAQGKCVCSGDKDDCHGCALWPD